MILCVEHQGDPGLAQVALARCRIRTLFRACERWQEQRGEDADDRNHDQKLDKCKARSPQNPLPS